MANDRRPFIILAIVSAVFQLSGCDEPGFAHDNALRALTPVSQFGSNPGALDMFTYLPAAPAEDAPLVVALHGCTQSASDYDDETGWTELSERYGFYLLLPEQKRSNNSSFCFNWFEPGDTRRGQGEAQSIKSMVDTMLSTYDIDPSRVYITGLSAGAFMTSVMLATYPETFSGGGVIAGGPYQCATGLIDAFTCMNGNTNETPQQWGDRVRNATDHTGPWPRVSIWHGTADFTVRNSNARESVEQWTNVHETDTTVDVHETIQGYPHDVYFANGEPVVEYYEITGMGHGTPIDPGDAEDQCGSPGAYVLDVGICSSYHLTQFWGIDGDTPPPPPGDTSTGGEPVGSSTGGAFEESTDDGAFESSSSGGEESSTGDIDDGPFCGLANNLEHFEAGRAIRLGIVPFDSYAAKGSFQWMGYPSQSTTLRETSPGVFVLASSCP